MLTGLAAACIALAPIASPPPANLAAWLKTGNAFRSYIVEADLAVFRSGNSSGHLGSRASIAEREFGVLSQFVRADNYRGKRVRFTAYMKTKEAAGLGAALWMRIDAARGSLAMDNMHARMIKGTTDWAQVSVVLDVADDALGFQLGIMLIGSGDAWVDDATFEVVGTDVPVTMPSFPNPGGGLTAEMQRLYTSSATAPVNLSFESEAPRTIAPASNGIGGWGRGGYGAQFFTLDTDHAIFRSGSSSGRLAARGPLQLNEFGTLAQNVSVEAYRGKRLRYTAYVRTKDVAGMGAGIWMRVDSERGVAALDDMAARAIRGTTDWAQVSVVLDIPADALGLQLGLRLSGTGDAWIDDGSLEVVGSDVPVTAQPAANPAPFQNLAQVRQMYSYAQSAPVNLGFEPRP